LVFLQNGSMTDASSFGLMTSAPAWLEPSANRTFAVGHGGGAVVAAAGLATQAGTAPFDRKPLQTIEMPARPR
jgi:hypothetical protein